MPSYTQLNESGGVETVTPMQIEETIKGKLATTINVVEPGGEFGGVAMIIPGAPRFDAGQRMLLFLANVGKDRWAVTELVLGKFSFTTDKAGRPLLARDAQEIVGWDPNLQPHIERSRDAAKFLDFVRAEAKNQSGRTDYFVDSEPVMKTPKITATSTPPKSIAPNVAPYTATSYTSIISGSLGSRWNVFPGAVTFYTGATQEPGAPGGGVTAAQTALAAWNNDCASNVNYVYGGTDTTHTSGLHGADGANTILFEQDLSSWGIAPFSCSSNSASGTLGIGGVTNASGTHMLGSETFVTTLEADVMMNKGLANCSLLFNNGDFNSAVTHEVGHTLGFRHADQDRNNSSACSTDPSLECSSSAIMTAFVTQGLNATLQTWDQHAVDAVYPGGTCSTANPAQVISVTPNVPSPEPEGTTITWTATASGGTAPLSYRWWRFSYATASWTLVQDWSTSNTFTWATKSGDAGEYQLQVDVRSAGATSPDSSGRSTDYYITAGTSANAPTVTSVTSNLPSPQPEGTSITWTATATGGTAPLSYRWWRFSYATASWTLVQDWSTSNTFTWATKSGDAGQYQFQVDVRSANTTNKQASGRSSDFTITSSLSVVSVTPNLPSPQPEGTTITWTAAVSGGTAPLSYRWWRFSYSSGTWTLVQDWSTSNTFTWATTPGTTGTYQFQVDVRSSGQTAVGANGRSADYTIAPEVVVTSLTPNKPSPQRVGTTITWTATAQGGVPPLSYRFWQFSYATGTWTLMQDWSTSNTFNWTPTAAGSYQFQVDVRSANATTRQAVGRSNDYTINP